MNNQIYCLQTKYAFRALSTELAGICFAQIILIRLSFRALLTELQGIFNDQTRYLQKFGALSTELAGNFNTKTH